MNASVRRPTRLEAVVLGLLVERPAHGYGLKARLGPGLPRERRINDGVLYPLLARLERLGLASSSERHDGGRRRRVYAATAAGEAAFREWLCGDLDEGAGLDHELFIDHPLVKLLFAGQMTAAELDAKIAALLAAARQRLAALDAVPVADGDGAGAGVGAAVLAVGRAREKAVIEQLERLRGAMGGEAVT
jgi:DNA-binding PadR family transcriptional regulator